MSGGKAEDRQPDATIKAYILNKNTQIPEGGFDILRMEAEGVVKGVQGDLEGIVKRRKEIEGFGIIHAESKFTELIGEAVMTYELQFYYSTIAICGTMAERICYDFIDLSEIVFNGKPLTMEQKAYLYDLPFRQLLEFLAEMKIIDDASKSALHEIYNIRNKYVHFKTSQNPQSDALKVLNSFCRIAERLFSMFRFYDVKDGKFVKKGS
jgi:hypothetical protein